MALEIHSMLDSDSKLNLVGLVITSHAIDRFLQRWQLLGNSNVPKKPEKTIKKLLFGAKEEEIDPVKRVARLLNNKFVEALYMVNQGWRLVLVKGDNGPVLVTVELVKLITDKG